MIRTRPLAVALAATALSLLTITTTTARAEVCGNVGASVECLDAQTLGWCDYGQLETLSCPTGEICTHHEVFGGGYGCVPLDQTACGDIPAEGLCTSANTVIWCNEEGEMKHQTCDEGTLCSWDASENWYDCVPATMQVIPEDSDGFSGVPWDSSLDTVNNEHNGQFDDLGPLSEDTTGPTPNRGPTPGVSASDDGATTAGTSTQSSGCSGGPAPDGSLWVLLALGALLFVRRPVANHLDAGRAV